MDNTNNPSRLRKLLPEHASKAGHKWIYWRRVHLSRMQWAIVSACLALVVASGVLLGAMIYNNLHSRPAEAPEIYAKIEKPKTVPSRLTGVQVDPAMNKRPVTGIMIENSPDARPQSGLREAGVVFEAIAEGGITRFLALYQEAQPKYIGPVRSVRPYYLDWLMGFDASIAHVGGAPQALIDIKTFNVKNLDQFFNADSYWRITSRYAPHNVYTSFARLDKLNKSKGFNSSKFNGFARKKDSPSKTPNAKSIDFAISGYYYNVHYKYNPKTNSYLRYEGGEPHVDEKSRKQLSPKVVVALILSRGIAGDGEHTNYGTTGIGTMYVFQDGTVKKGVWKKTSRRAEIQLLDMNDHPFELNPGQTWLTALDSSSLITYK